MTKNFGQDFDLDHPSRGKVQKPKGPLDGLLPTLLGFLVPIALAGAAIYISRYGFHG
jgi:hypothetical protein